MAENVGNNDKNLENSTNRESERKTDLNPPVVDASDIYTKQKQENLLMTGQKKPVSYLEL